MSDYIDGYEIIAILGIEPFVLVQLAKRGDLRPFKFGIRVRDIEEKESFEKTDEYKLHLLKLEEGAENAGKVSPVKWRGLAVRPGLKSEIRALEERGVQPRSLKDLTPEKWRNCLWERFDLPANQAHAEKAIEKFKSFKYLKEDLAKIYPESFYNDDTKAPAVENVKGRGDNTLVPEDYVRKIKICYQNDEQFSIKVPQKPFEPCSWHHIECKSARTKEFRYLLEAIENGSFYASDRNSRIAFERGCKKLVTYIRGKYLPSLPKNFLIYKKEGKTYRLIFEREEDVAFDPYGKLEKLSKDVLIEKLNKYCIALKNPPPFEKDNDRRIWENNIIDKITNVSFVAQRKGVTQTKIKRILDQAGIKNSSSLDIKEGDSKYEFFDEGY